MKTIFAIAAALTCLGLVAGCGGPSEAEKKAVAEKKAAAAEKKEAERVAAERAEQQAAYDACETALRKLANSLSSINSRLSIGVLYEDYNTRVGDASVAYDKVDFDSLSDDCRASSEPLRGAINAYIAAANVWGDCMRDFDCDVNENPTKGKIDAKWLKADKAIKKHQRQLDALAPTAE